MINTEKTFKGIQPFRLGGGEHQGTIQGEWSTLRNPSRGFNPFRLGVGGNIRENTGGMYNTDKPFKGIQPFRLGGGENVKKVDWVKFSKLIS